MCCSVTRVRYHIAICSLWTSDVSSNVINNVTERSREDSWPVFDRCCTSIDNKKTDKTEHIAADSVSVFPAADQTTVGHVVHRIRRLMQFPHTPPVQCDVTPALVRREGGMLRGSWPRDAGDVSTNPLDVATGENRWRYRRKLWFVWTANGRRRTSTALAARVLWRPSSVTCVWPQTTYTYAHVQRHSDEDARGWWSLGWRKIIAVQNVRAW